MVTAARKKELDAAILRATIDASLAYSLFSQPPLVDLLNTLVPGYKAPCRQTISTRINNAFDSHMVELQAVMAKTNYVALTTDMWSSSSGGHFVCLTAHTFNRVFEPISLVLSFQEFTKSATASNIEEYLKHELEEKFRIKLLAGITTDNGANVKSSCRSGRFGPWNSCAAHTLNLVVQRGLSLWEMPNAKKLVSLLKNCLEEEA